jgi:hypothetical protein
VRYGTPLCKLLCSSNAIHEIKDSVYKKYLGLHIFN